MSREETILEYIETHDGCTKTEVENNTGMAEKTAKKYLKKLIDEGKVVYDIDEVNPQTHHLHINNPNRSEMKTKNFILSRMEEQIKNLICTTAQLEGGGWISSPVVPFTVAYPTVTEILGNQWKKPRTVEY